jgi:hypothetical protein
VSHGGAQSRGRRKGCSRVLLRRILLSLGVVPTNVRVLLAREVAPGAPASLFLLSRFFLAAAVPSRCVQCEPGYNPCLELHPLSSGLRPTPAHNQASFPDFKNSAGLTVDDARQLLDLPLLRALCCPGGGGPGLLLLLVSEALCRCRCWAVRGSFGCICSACSN